MLEHPEMDQKVELLPQVSMIGRVRRGLTTHLWAWRTYLSFFLTPIVASPLPLIIQTKESQCAYVLLLMAVYWVTDCLPVGITALLPVVMFPFFEIMGPSEIASAYLNDINMLFMGGLMVAVAIEYWLLHKRVALKIMMLLGSEPRWLMLGLMTASWFLSMWISNTATAAMMVPITEALLVEMEQTSRRDAESGMSTHESNGSIRNKGMEKKENKNSTSNRNEKIYLQHDKETTVEFTALKESSPKPRDPHFHRISIGMLLSICYAANCGGIASLTGTTPNLILKREVDKLYESKHLPTPINFGRWMTFGFPVSFIILIISWCWLQIVFLRCNGACVCCNRKDEQAEEKKRNVARLIRSQYKALGNMVFGQWMVMALFIAMVLLWITRDMGGVTGWGLAFDPKIKDGTAAVLICVLMFATPSSLPFLKSYPHASHPETDPRFGRVDKDTRHDESGGINIQPLLRWDFTFKRFSWDLILLLGGGFAISAGCQASGLSQWVGVKLTYFQDWNEYLILFIVCYISAITTEFASNTAVTSIMMPILQRLAIATRTHPLKYMLPSACACSFAYMLPVATPPNAIVFSSGRLKITDMIKAGFMMNLLTVPTLIGIFATVGYAIYDLDTVPEEFLNMTISTLSADIS